MRFPYPAQVNIVFVEAEDAVFSALRSRGWRFYKFIGGAARFMASLDTTEDDVEELASDFSGVMNGRKCKTIGTAPEQ